jgi:hypothetical protein
LKIITASAVIMSMVSTVWVITCPFKYWLGFETVYFQQLLAEIASVPGPRKDRQHTVLLGVPRTPQGQDGDQGPLFYALQVNADYDPA